MTAKVVNNMGVISISEQVLTTIASNAAMESYGIVGLTTKNATDGLFLLLGKDNMSKGVTVYTDNNRVTIDLTVILEYGVRISVVAENIIDNVKFAIEDKTGLKVEKINVLVQDFRVQEA